MSQDLGELPDPVPAGPPELRAEVRAAVETLRAHVSARALEVAPSLLSRIRSAPRRSLPLRHAAPASWLHVSERVLRRHLRAAIDGVVPGVAVQQIDLTADPRGQLQQVTVDLIGRYRTPLVQATDQVRELCLRVVRDLLGDPGEEGEDGELRAPGAGVAVTVNLHVGDVTLGDPVTSDPEDTH